METIYKMPKTFTQEYHNFKELDRFDNYALYEMSQDGKKHYECLNIRPDGRDNHGKVQATGNIGDINYRLEEMKARFEAERVRVANKKISEAEKIIKDREDAKIMEGIHAKHIEAKQMRQDAFLELNRIVCQAKDFKSVMKDKKAQDLIELISFIDTYSKSNYSTQYLQTA